MMALLQKLHGFPTVDRYYTELSIPQSRWNWGMVSESPYLRLNPTALIYQTDNSNTNYVYSLLPYSWQKKDLLPYMKPKTNINIQKQNIWDLVDTTELLHKITETEKIKRKYEDVDGTHEKPKNQRTEPGKRSTEILNQNFSPSISTIIDTPTLIRPSYQIIPLNKTSQELHDYSLIDNSIMVNPNWAIPLQAPLHMTLTIPSAQLFTPINMYNYHEASGFFPYMIYPHYQILSNQGWPVGPFMNYPLYQVQVNSQVFPYNHSPVESDSKILNSENTTKMTTMTVTAETIENSIQIIKPTETNLTQTNIDPINEIQKDVQEENTLVKSIWINPKAKAAAQPLTKSTRQKINVQIPTRAKSANPRSKIVHKQKKPHYKIIYHLQKTYVPLW